MLKIRTQRKIKFVTLDHGTAWVVVAFLVEMRDGVQTVVSVPRIVKIVEKRYYGLPSGKKNQSVFFLPTLSPHFQKVNLPIESPFISTIFGFTNSDVVIGLAARPPTFS